MVTEPGPMAAAPPASRRRMLLADRAFRAAWAMGTLTGIARWLDTLVIGIYVFDQTASALLVAVYTFLRLAPLSLFGAFMGVFGDRLGRRRLLVIANVLALGVYILLFLLIRSGAMTLWHLAIAVFLTGSYWAADLPLRRTLVGELAGPNRIGAAMSLDAATLNVTRMLGPIIGGILYKLWGLEGSIACSALLFAAAVWCQTALPRVETVQGRGVSVLANLREGFDHVRRNRLFRGVLAVTVIYNIWGFPFTAMIPVIGKDVLGLGPAEVGLLSGAEGIGALVTAAAIALFARPVWYPRIFYYGTCCQMLLVLCLSLSTSVVMVSGLVVAIGLAAACFSAMQSTLAFLSAPPAVRGRIMGVLSVAIGSGPIGFAHLGLLADWLGAQRAMTVMVIEGLVLLAICYVRLPELRAPMPPP